MSSAFNSDGSVKAGASTTLSLLSESLGIDNYGERVPKRHKDCAS